MNKPGSSLVLIIMIVAIITLVGLNTLRSSIMIFESALQRLSYTQKTMALDGLLSYAIVKKTSDSRDWNVAGLESATANINTQKQDNNTTKVSVQLMYNNNIIGTGESIVRTSNDSLSILSWNISCIS